MESPERHPDGNYDKRISLAARKELRKIFLALAKKERSETHEEKPPRPQQSPAD
jgi:hypothetical protein